MAKTAKFEHELGKKLRDRISGFEGVCTSRHEYLNGCKRYALVAEISKPNQEPIEMYFDEAQLEPSKGGRKVDQSDTGGPQRRPPAVGMG